MHQTSIYTIRQIDENLLIIRADNIDLIHNGNK